MGEEISEEAQRLADLFPVRMYDKDGNITQEYRDKISRRMKEVWAKRGDR